DLRQPHTKKWRDGEGSRSPYRLNVVQLAKAYSKKTLRRYAPLGRTFGLPGIDCEVIEIHRLIRHVARVIARVLNLHVVPRSRSPLLRRACLVRVQPVRVGVGGRA